MVHPDCRIAEDMKLLLDASLLSGEGALGSWRRWKSDRDLDQLRGQALALLPLLYRNLLAHEVDDPMMPALKQRYTGTWFQNQMLLKRASGDIDALQKAGLEAMLLKGAAMTAAYYRDFGVRPMGDVDILVKPDRLDDAVAILESRGLTPKPVPTDDLVRYSHSTHLEAEDGFTIDLHWRLVWEFGPATPVSSFWDGARTTELHGVQTTVLNPVDQFFHICVNVGRSSEIPVRYVADAVTILNRFGRDLDVERLLATAARHRLISTARRTLDCTRRWADAPDSLEDGLRRMKLSFLERIPIGSPTAKSGSQVGKAPKMLTRFLRITDRQGILSRLRELPHFLVFYLDLNSAGEIPRALFDRMLRRLKRLLKKWRASRTRVL